MTNSTKTSAQNGSMNQSSPQNQTTSSTMQNKQNANMTNNTASGTLTAQYDANGKP